MLFACVMTLFQFTEYARGLENPPNTSHPSSNGRGDGETAIVVASGEEGCLQWPPENRGSHFFKRGRREETGKEGTGFWRFSVFFQNYRSIPETRIPQQMGGPQSREGLNLSDSSDYKADDEKDQYDNAQDDDDRHQPKQPHISSGTKTLDELDSKLKYPNPRKPNLANAVKLYLHVGGNTPKAKWVVSNKFISYKFVKNDEDCDDESSRGGDNYWVLKVGSKIRAGVSTDLQLKMFGDQRRVDFVWNGVWVLKPEAADDSMWEDAEDGVWKSPAEMPVRENLDLLEEFEEEGTGGGSSSAGKMTPKKSLLMRGETNMTLMSPLKEGKPHSTGLHQLDIETWKVVTEWKFEKDGTDITMRDITNDTKGSQLDPSESTFLGLDDNRLCQWDMRDKKGIVQNIASSNSPVLNWTRASVLAGDGFSVFATAGDGSIVVGSLDGKIRLYSKTSMRQAKTAFLGLGSPITHVDVTYDGKWVLGTTDTYLILICTLFTDKDWKTKTGFSGQMGNKIPAPRLLKLTPVTENGKQERHIVEVGKFSVIWNFQQVKNSSHEFYRNQQGLKSFYCYKIVLKDESIVDSWFMHDRFAISNSPEAPLVVATPMKVTSFSMSGSKR
ncbi:vacuolar import/degradation, Vid27-related protein [Actinidia rufa]|uniref:Vacuolar import/degradation, Vid27-related protein n=1 Tax=Actinidia rufa TaxID=165716 RepID=A0A7J0DS50_9ERIC|nr:vacuolar import/degradation, Vid27-related protein [Actinidia rufa]